VRWPRGWGLTWFALAAVAVLGEFAPAVAAPLGDARMTSAEPAAGWVYTCGPVRRVPAPDLPWTRGGRYRRDLEPVVDGAVRWPQAAFSLSRARSAFAGNGLPVGKPSGVFPVAATDDAAPYAGQAAAPRAQQLRGSIPGAPRPRRPRCVGATVPVGVALDGVPILPPFTRSGRDAVAHEVNDACGGRTDSAGRYYYRSDLACMLPRTPRRTHSRQVGWARDGFPIFGPLGSGGLRLRSRDLDACHGHAHAVTIGGERRVVYHYHLTGDFPYTVGCFRAPPATDWVSTPSATPQGDAPGGGDTRGDTPAADLPGEAPAPPDERDDVRVTAAPSLQPAFDPHASDYVVRCSAGEPVRLNVDAPSGVDVAIDRQPGRSGQQTTSVPLAESQSFAFTATSRLGTRDYHVRCLPSDFPAYSAERAAAPQAQWYVVSPTLSTDQSGITGFYTAVFDAHGAPVWWMREKTRTPTYDARLLPDNRIMWASPVNNGYPYSFRTLDGIVTQTLSTVGTPTDLHDLQPLPGGNYLLMSYPTREHVDLSPYGGPSDALVLDAELQEITPSGQLVWSWNSKDHIELEETGHWYADYVIPQPQPLGDGRKAYDIVHMNSLEPDGDGILVSMRHTDSVYRIRRADGAVDWKLGGTARPESLTVEGDHYAQPLGGQHDARVLPGGHVSIHDNGSALGRPPRAVVYRIDPVLGTATLTDEVGDPRAPSSFCCGSARRLSGGNWVLGWGSRSFMTELSPSGQPVLTIHYPELFSYRAQPVEPGVVAASALRAGMDAMHPR
jgi:hypothetical protein